MEPRTLTRVLSPLLLGFALSLQLPAGFGISPAPPAPRAASSSTDEGWPRQLVADGTELTIYQPQLDSWNGRRLKARAAVSVRPPGARDAIFGVLWISARTDVDKENRLVDLEQVEFTKASFPSAPASEEAYLELFRRARPPGPKTIALDRLEASLAILEERRRGAALPLRHEPPRILFSREPAILVTVDGPPVYRAVQGTALERVLNTRPLLLREASGTHYLHLFDGWMSAVSIDGPWSVLRNPPPELGRAIEILERAGAPVDLLEGEVPATRGAAAGGASPSEPARPTLAKGPVPVIFVATSPTDLVVTEGEPVWVPIEGTRLLYVKNTTGNIFKDLADQRMYILLSGRWFRAASESGPWQYVSGKELAADFANIPDDSPKENVKASVPGTAQAAEALIANDIPQTARVERKSTEAAPPEYDGEPRLARIPGTPLQYVVNASVPVLLVEGKGWYMVENGVWFVASSPNGPWAVADSVPPEIYSIPPDSPLHYVTYVRVYDTTAEDVCVGYTPGYTGTFVDDDGLVVYGTGYVYPPWIGSVWYGPPVTWGLGFGLAWTPWWGWSFNVGFGWGWGPDWVWGCLPPPWWGPIGWGWGYGGWYWHGGGMPPRQVHWRPGGWPSAGGGIYRRWGPHVKMSPRPAPAPALNVRHPVGLYGRAYNSRTGELAGGERGHVRNVYPAPRPAAPRTTPSRPPNNVFAGPDGNVYRRNGTGTWQRVAPRDGRPPEPARVQPLERERRAREVGDRRSGAAARPPSPPPQPPRSAPRPPPPRGGTGKHG